MSVRLGPALLGTIFDGLLRPISDLSAGPYMTAGIDEASAESFRFVPLVRVGDRLAGGAAFGRVENAGGSLQHAIVPPRCPGGEVVEVAPEGVYRDDEIVCRLREGTTTHELAMSQRWPVRVPRPVARPASGRRADGDAGNASSTACSRSRAAARRPFREASAQARPCCSRRSPSGATPTSSSTSGAASAATRWPACSRSSRTSRTRAAAARCSSAP